MDYFAPKKERDWHIVLAFYCLNDYSISINYQLKST